MAECEFIELCPFFNDQLGDRPDEVDKMKEQYCKTNNLNCARYMIANAAGDENIPQDLFPHEKTRAYAIIAEKG
ncbi:MAG: hypothetical protein B6241_07530 [Spirochaetaceae bacterium 4572_59]|nr:MAG: hypothetical protein B6241_07530 [Spirochaetaceae bacterium 4572_59]